MGSPRRARVRDTSSSEKMPDARSVRLAGAPWTHLPEALTETAAARSHFGTRSARNDEAGDAASRHKMCCRSRNRKPVKMFARRARGIRRQNNNAQENP